MLASRAVKSSLTTLRQSLATPPPPLSIQQYLQFTYCLVRCYILFQSIYNLLLPLLVTLFLQCMTSLFLPPNFLTKTLTLYFAFDPTARCSGYECSFRTWVSFVSFPFCSPWKLRQIIAFSLLIFNFVTTVPKKMLRAYQPPVACARTLCSSRCQKDPKDIRDCRGVKIIHSRLVLLAGTCPLTTKKSEFDVFKLEFQS